MGARDQAVGQGLDPMPYALPYALGVLIGVPRMAWPSLPLAPSQGCRVTSWHEGRVMGLRGCVGL